MVSEKSSVVNFFDEEWGARGQHNRYLHFFETQDTVFENEMYTVSRYRGTCIFMFPETQRDHISPNLEI